MSMYVYIYYVYIYIYITLYVYMIYVYTCLRQMIGRRAGGQAIYGSQPSRGSFATSCAAYHYYCYCYCYCYYYYYRCLQNKRPICK